MSSRRTEDDLRALDATLRHILKDEKPWKDPLASAALVARMLRVPQRVLTELVARRGETFSAMLNACRVEEFERLMARDPSRGVQKAALEAGFGSTAYFAKVYRALRGVNPKSRFVRNPNR